MKKPKTIKKFFFKDRTHQEVSDDIDSILPIDLVENQDLIERIYSQYPIINKAEISFIVKEIFKAIRQLLILGNILNFNGLLFDTKFYFYRCARSDGTIAKLKINASTPMQLKI